MRGPFTTALGRARGRPQDLTLQLSRALEDEVRAASRSLFWVHRRWKTRPE